MRAAEKAAYDKVDSLVPSDTNVDVSGTAATASKLTSPTGNAAIDNVAVHPDVRNISDAIAAAAPDGTLTYDAATKLKSTLGNMIDWGPLADSQRNAPLKTIWGSLKDNIDSTASSVSPEAKQAVSDASDLYSANQDKRALIGSIIDKAGGPEAVYNAATSGLKSGPTKISQVMQQLDPDSQNLVRASVIKRLGTAVASKQDAAGEIFDPSTFLTRWNQLDSGAKNALFGTSGTPGQLRAGLDSFTNTLSTLKKSNALPNPLGTADKAGHLAGFALILDGLSKALEIGGGALSGHAAVGAAGAAGGLGVVGALGGAAGGIAANYGLARVMTSPTVVRWLASTSKLGPAARVAAISQLGRMQDPDAKALYNSLGTQPVQARASGGPVNQGQPYLVGEHGPEVMVPDQSGHIVPSPQLAKARAMSAGGPPVGVDLSRVKYK